MTPLIGLTCGTNYEKETAQYFLSKTYADVICKAGGIPIILPSIDNGSLTQLLNRIDGLILTGGVDVNPLFYDEEPHPKLGTVDPLRDNFEVALAQEALDSGIPIIGICRGMQLLNVVAGGKLHQDIPSLNISNAINHRQQAPAWSFSHKVVIEEGTRLEKIIGQKETFVNSFHHQAVKTIAPGFIVSARSSDGIIEAIEKDDSCFIIGVQWHPEGLSNEDSRMFAIFESFCQACKD
jgi:putative glutamine amidotransferase